MIRELPWFPDILIEAVPFLPLPEEMEKTLKAPAVPITPGLPDAVHSPNQYLVA
jgi:hypothetical protein